MRLNPISLTVLFLSGVFARLQTRADGSASDATAPTPDEDGKYWIHGEGLSAAFIPYGASISNLLIKDKRGIKRDIVAGFDNATYYGVDKQHPHLGGVPGRYANRIKNSSFEIDDIVYNVLANENPTAEHPDGIDTLHGGPDGWDWRNFTVVSHSDSSITFSIVDPDAAQGFPGEVISYITYTLGDMTWDLKMVAIPTTKKTPIMLSSHTYWNLDGFANNETNTALNHTFYLPYSGQRVGVDNILIPTGDIIANHPGSVNDFWSSPKQIGAGFADPEIHNNCGFNCSGYGRRSQLPDSQGWFANLIDRHLLAREPRAKRPLRLAGRGRLRGASAVSVVGYSARRLHGPGGLPNVLVQWAERVPDPEDHAGPVR